MGNKKTHRVFVYGTLIEGESNAHWAGNAKRERATANGTLYDTGYGFPALELDGDNPVIGEIITVDDDGLAMTDRLEGYPRLYRREKITVVTHNGKTVSAFVYIMNNRPNNSVLIESGDWVSYRKGKED